jgi:hypothetical protein
MTLPREGWNDLNERERVAEEATGEPKPKPPPAAPLYGMPPPKPMPTTPPPKKPG